MDEDAPYMVRVARLQENAVKWLYHNLPDSDWESWYMECRKAGPVAESVAHWTMSDGSVEPVAPPAKMISALVDLRDQMASLGRGAWLSMTLHVTKDGKYGVHFNYDEPPAWKAPIADRAYIEDLKKYPRPADTIPEWYPHS